VKENYKIESIAYKVCQKKPIFIDNTSVKETSICLLRCPCGGFLFQLRDDVGDISFPGVWGLFGGGIENSESPSESLVRELYEELNLEVKEDDLSFVCVLIHEQYIPFHVEHVFTTKLCVSQDKLILGEGQEMECLKYEVICSGRAYSKLNCEKRPVASPILALFKYLEKHGSLLE